LRFETDGNRRKKSPRRHFRTNGGRGEGGNASKDNRGEGEMLRNLQYSRVKGSRLSRKYVIKREAPKGPTGGKGSGWHPFGEGGKGYDFISGERKLDILTPEWVEHCVNIDSSGLLSLGEKKSHSKVLGGKMRGGVKDVEGQMCPLNRRGNNKRFRTKRKKTSQMSADGKRS